MRARREDGNHSIMSASLVSLREEQDVGDDAPVEDAEDAGASMGSISDQGVMMSRSFRTGFEEDIEAEEELDDALLV